MFAIKEIGRTLRNRRRLLLPLAAILALYWALPAVIAEFLGYRLALAGFDQIDVRAGRPSWNELRFDTLQLSRRSGNRISTLRVAELTVRYRPSELLSGRLIAIRGANAEIESRAVESEAPAQDDAAESLGPLAFAPGHWLSRLPADEVSLEKLDLHFQTPAGGHFTAHAAVHIRDGQAVLTGEIRPAEEQPFTFSAHAAASGEFELDVRAPGVPEPPILHIANRADEKETGHLNIDGSARAKLDGIAGLLRPWFGSGEDPPRIEGSVESRWHGAVPVAGGTWEGVAIGSDHNVRIGIESSTGAIRNTEFRIRADAWIEGSRIRWRIGNESALSARFKGPMNYQAEPVVAMTFPNGLAGLVEMASERRIFHFTPGFPLHLAPIQWNGVSSSGIDIELASGATLRYDPHPGRWAVEPFALSTKPVSLNWRDGAIETAAMTFGIAELGGEKAEWAGKGELRVAGLEPTIRDKPLPGGDVLIEFQGNSKQLDLESTATLSQGRLILKGRARQPFDGGRGSAQLELAPVVFGESGFVLSRLLESWPYPFDIHAGRVDASVRSSWTRPASHGKRESLHFENEVAVNAEGLAGRIKTMAFNDLDAHLTLTDRNGLRTIDPARLSVARIDAGIPITDLSVDAAVTSHSGSAGLVIDLRQFAAHLLGGTVRGDPFRWNAAHPEAPVVLDLNGLSLDKIVALEKQQGLEGSGVLDGRLPLEIARTHVAVRGGELRARPPGGWIRYRPTEKVRAMTQDNVSLQFVNQALSNLRYKTLKVKADSTPKGDLTLRVELKGHNPDWQSGRPIHLNLSLQENIPMLLHSLNIADDLTDRVNRQIQERYRKKR